MADVPGPPDFLIHDSADTVAVAVRDLTAGPARGAYLTGDEIVSVDLPEDIQLGHKIALAAMTEGQDVIEYGERIGIALRDIPRGGYVHVHNIGSARWRSSVA